MKDTCGFGVLNPKVDVASDGKHSFAHVIHTGRHVKVVGVGRRRGGEGKAWVVVSFEYTRQHHSGGGGVGVQVASHPVAVLQDDAVRHLSHVVGVHTAVLHEGHVEGAVDVQAVLLREEDVLRVQVNAVHGRAGRHVHADHRSSGPSCAARCIETSRMEKGGREGEVARRRGVREGATGPRRTRRRARRPTEGTRPPRCW